MKVILKNIFYSFPVQLFVLHFKHNHLMLFFWLLLWSMVTGIVGKIYGTKYLYLNPEYLNEVSFYSFFILGVAFGGFIMSWNITNYILHSYRFPFLASLGRPFSKFCINNSIIPFIFLVAYFVWMIHFQWYNEFAPLATIIGYCSGFLLGVVVLLLITALYFNVTNVDIKNVLKTPKKAIPQNLVSLAARKIQKKEEQHLDTQAWPVEYFITEYGKVRPTRNVDHYSPDILMKVFRQNHDNALVLQVVSVVVLILMGSLMEHPFFRIPAGASSMILFALIVSLSGAITYWFGAWRTFVFVGVLILLNLVTGNQGMMNENTAYGLDYNKTTPYTYQQLDSIHSPKQVSTDVDSTLKILKTWRSKFGTGRLMRKPKMVLITSSGGGLRQAVWTMHVMQTADSLLNGKLFKNTVLISGASGGMLGAACMRDLKYNQVLGDTTNIYDVTHVHNLAKDLLNPIVFTSISNDIFLPWMTFQKNGRTYKKDRGYIFERQFIENNNGLVERDLQEYKTPEQNADIPLLFATPVIINDARRLIISPQGVSYMANSGISQHTKGLTEIDAIDFGLLFKDQDPYQMSLMSALRMNCTYPYILPNVYLPTEPPIQVMDAGWRDNFGTESVIRFANVFSDWIKENTSGVIIIQIRGTEKVDKMDDVYKTGIINRILNPINVAGLNVTLQDYQHDHTIDYLSKILEPRKIDLIRMTYRPSKTNARASMSWHLTNREKIDIMNAIYQEDNQKNLMKLQDLIH